MILKRYKDYINNKINESVIIKGFQVIPEGSAIPKGITKFGVDPTASDLHLGHMIPMLMVKKLKEQGNDIHIILGDFTAMLGDPSGRNSMRPMLTSSQTKSNADQLISQIKRIIGNDITIHYNSEWFNKMNLSDFMSILSKFTVDYLMSREAFQKRKESGSTIGAHEIIVPLLQGLDSVELETQIEVGGSDQRFNFLLSRDVQERMGQKPEICLLSPIINGLDGERKMSKSFNNCIFLNDSPKDVFGKAMSISDKTMLEWLPIFMESYDQNKHPMELKKSLAATITDLIWPPGQGQKERSNFESTVQNKALPTDIPLIDLNDPDTGKSYDFITLVSMIGGISKSESRRMLNANAVSVNDVKVKDPNTQLKSGDIVKVGKRNFGKIE